MAVDKVQMFIDDCAFAKVVETAKGDALLIGGRVIQFAEGEKEAVDLLSIALRRLSHGHSHMSGTAQSGQIAGSVLQNSQYLPQSPFQK